MAASSAVMRREVKVIGLVGFAHHLSHLYQLSLPPLFTLIRADLGISYAELGLVMTVFYLATGVLQTPMGLLVDRVGARRVLIGGMFLSAAPLLLAGTVESLGSLVALFLISGIGNSVFHPADYTILNASVDETRLGRAFSLHTFGGLAGFAVAPPLMLVLASLFDWRAALVIVGAVGIATGIVLVLFRALLRDDAERRKTAGMQALRQLLTRPLILMFLFTTFSSATSAGIYNFSIAAFVDIYGVELALASSSLTIFVVMTAAGVLPGGMLADKAGRHDLVLVVCTVIVIACILLAGWGALPFWLALGALGLAGLARGIVNASRDLMVRHIAGGASVGTAFAFVTTGFMVGQSAAPVFYGWLMDAGQPHAVFWAGAGFSVLAIGTVFLSRERTL